MRVSNGDVVRMRDKRIVKVTDAADVGEPEGFYQSIERDAWLEDGREIVTSSIPAETIFVGVDLKTNRTVVSDMSEVVDISPALAGMV